MARAIESVLSVILLFCCLKTEGSLEVFFTTCVPACKKCKRKRKTLIQDLNYYLRLFNCCLYYTIDYIIRIHLRRYYLFKEVYLFDVRIKENTEITPTLQQCIGLIFLIAF